MNWRSTCVCLVSLAVSAACGAEATPVGKATPTYSATTGKLERLTLDRDGDGRPDTWAVMDGTHLQSVEIDRHNSGHADRWEYYAEGTGSAASKPTSGSVFDRKTVLVRAEEANGPDGKTVTRREFYTDGVIARVEEDTDFDGKIDKWEVYDHGALTQMDLDVTGRGKPDRRLVYRGDGTLDHVEVDPAGSGHFVPAPKGGVE
jgi:hypothetical protein